MRKQKMKTSFFSPIFAVALGVLGLAGSAGAATVLVNNTTLNGSFETGTTSTPATWVSYGANSTIGRGNPSAAISGTTHEGNYSLVVGMNGDGVTTTNGALDTGYTIQSGDSFNLSFWYNGAFQWDDGDQINFRLFYTSDNTMTGAATSIYSSTVSPKAGTSSANWQQFSLANIEATGGSVGKTLFVLFTPGAGVSTNEFARVDEVTLSVVPEPATWALIGLGLGGLMILRPRRLVA